MSGKKDKVKDKDRFSILVPSLERCCLCGSTYMLTIHEVFYGTSNRKKSKEDGMTVPLCGGCHSAVHSNDKLDLRLKQNAEKIWIETYTDSSLPMEDRIELFIERYGKNYLE